MSAESKENAPAGEAVSKGPPARGPRRSLFVTITFVLGAVAMSLIVWRISRAWRLEYGSGAPPSRPIPTTGSFGAPSDLAR